MKKFLVYSLGRSQVHVLVEFKPDPAGVKRLAVETVMTTQRKKYSLICSTNATFPKLPLTQGKALTRIMKIKERGRR